MLALLLSRNITSTYFIALIVCSNRQRARYASPHGCWDPETPIRRRRRVSCGPEAAAAARAYYQRVNNLMHTQIERALTTPLVRQLTRLR